MASMFFNKGNYFEALKFLYYGNFISLLFLYVAIPNSYLYFNNLTNAIHMNKSDYRGEH